MTMSSSSPPPSASFTYLAPLQDASSRQSSCCSTATKMKDLLSSKDWMSDYQQSHVDVDPKTVFASSSSSALTAPALRLNAAAAAGSSLANAPTTTSTTSTSATSSSSTCAAKQKTDWAGEYYRILLGPRSAVSSTEQRQFASSMHKAIPQYPVVAKLRSRSLSSGGGSTNSIGSRSSSIDAMMKPSVDFTSLFTSSIDAAMNNYINQSSTGSQDENRSVLLSSQDLVASIVPPETASGEILAAAAAESAESGPIPMDHEEEQPPAVPFVTDVAMILALSKKQKAQAQQQQEAAKNKLLNVKKKTKRTTNSREPLHKVHVEPRDADVFLGRGGRSNHHSGNIAYRNHVGTLRDWYRASDKNAKTVIAQELVDWVHTTQEGRFLKLDEEKCLEDGTDRYYVVTNIVARRKASQALREHMTPEERNAANAARRR